MVDECKAVGLREPQIVSSEYLVTTTFFRNDVNELLQDKLQDKLPDKLLFMIGEDGNVTIEHLSKILGVSEKTVRIHLKRLTEKGLIARVGARKNGHWQVVKLEN